MSSPSVKWTQPHTLAALHLYTLLPFGKLHHGTPEIQQLAAWEVRTPSSVAMKLVNFASLDRQIIEEIKEPLAIEEGKMRSAWVQVRVNQARFRNSVLASYHATCCIRGLQHEKLVIASHIVSWRMDRKNHLNPQNGLCLSALHDKAYDQGLITVMPDFTVRVSPAFKAHQADSFMADALLRFNGQAIRLPERFRPAPEFLAFHARAFGFIA